MKIDLFHEFVARVLVAYIDAVAAVVVGIEYARVDLDNGEVQGVLTRVCGKDDGRSPDELPEYTVLFRLPMSGNIVAEGLESSQPLAASFAFRKSCLAALRSLADTESPLPLTNSILFLASGIANSWPLISRSMAASFSLKPEVPRMTTSSCV